MSRDSFDEYLRRVIDPQDGILFEEAVRAARASAPRAAYITFWLSCAESLKRKFIEASQFDNIAGRIVGEIKDKEAKKQAIDAFILHKAMEFGFISDSEYSQLDSIYALRCVFGHPYEQAPIPEQLLAAAASVVEFVLSRPTKLRHGYLDRQVDLICHDRTFLDDHYPAVQHYATVVHARASTDLHLWFLKKLWRNALPLVSDPSQRFFTRRIISFSTAFLQCTDGSVFDEWDVIQDLTQYSFISTILAIPDLYSRIGEHAQDIVIGNLLTAARSHAPFLKTLEVLHTNTSLTERQSERFLEAIGTIPLHVVVAAGVHPKYYAEKIISDLKSHNWYTQNPAIEAIINMEPTGIASLPTSLQRELGNNVLQAAEGNATKAISFLVEISTAATEWPEAFIEGVVEECFVNEKNEFRYKDEHAGSALLALCAVPSVSRKAIVSRLVGRLQTSTQKYDCILRKEPRKMFEVMSDLIKTNTDLYEVLVSLKNALTELEKRVND